MNTERTNLFLMANLGSEFAQLFMFLRTQRHTLAEHAGLRAKKILEELRGRPDMGPRKVEVDMLTLIIDDALLVNRTLEITESQMENYFQPFALRLFAQR